ncbi:MAG TPA: AAA family ATPase [Paludibacteraceae bacterium]|nr:AAA family ATPase [Paludibacteraceae bacterium]
MLYHFLAEKIQAQLPFEPTTQQEACIELLAQFCTTISANENHAFLLTGYAGTGKTSLVSALVNVLTDLQQKTVLLAPTGRAAKVFSNYAHQPAYSIHKKIYRQKSGSNEFQLNFNSHKDTLFFVDEASMISNTPGDGSHFGSGRLLDDLMEFIYTGDNCRLILIGDIAQLPPVMQPLSPALDKLKLESYGLTVAHAELTEVVRQTADSGILHNATLIRQALTENRSTLELNSKFDDVQRINGTELIDEIHAAFGRSGIENCIIITRSNKRAILYNRGIRNQVLFKEDELSTGDLLLVTRNNYFWNKEYPDLEFIANGDIAEIIRVRKQYNIYNLRFADVTLNFLDYDCEMDTRIVLDSLYTETAAEADQLYKKLLAAVEEDFMEIGNRRERYKAMMKSEFLNALHVKFGYAITCHKAQGGQWQEVFLDQGGITGEMIDSDYLRWLYTAFTRAEKKLFLVNFNDNFFN